MTPVEHPVAAPAVADLRLARRALRAEHARVGRWRRAVRAHLDLAVATTVPPEPLGEDVAFLLPLDVSVQVPRATELGACLGVDRQAAVRDVLRLRDLDARLGRYEAGVARELAARTAELVDRVARDPAGVLVPVHDHAPTA